jgi:hypothetical protein
MLTLISCNWFISDLRDYGDEGSFFDDEDSLGNYALLRLRLLENEIKPLQLYVAKKTKEESESFFPVELDGTGIKSVPKEINGFLNFPNGNPTDRWITYPSGLDLPYPDEEFMIAQAILKSSENKVIVWDAELYLLPKEIPDSLIEIWWRWYFYCMPSSSYFTGMLYPQTLKKDALFGWVCYGHER